MLCSPEVLSRALLARLCKNRDKLQICCYKSSGSQRGKCLVTVDLLLPRAGSQVVLNLLLRLRTVVYSWLALCSYFSSSNIYKGFQNRILTNFPTPSSATHTSAFSTNYPHTLTSILFYLNQEKQGYSLGVIF